LRNSIRTSVGYLGFLIAAALALSHLGLGFERLAIIAGALSVGIGFGLQSIVNNFVSGLILLWERAIRVGDWIVVGQEEGYVRRISVRATEIETFDRAVVIVPNANLVAGLVKNWVRLDRVGRVRIPVAVTPRAEPEMVRDMLLAVARASEEVMKLPSPQVFFLGFGEPSLKFELVCFVAEVEAAARVRSDLTFDIYAKLRAGGLEVPPPTPIALIEGAWARGAPVLDPARG
jgi:small-conductance mechanosensitive channel